MKYKSLEVQPNWAPFIHKHKTEIGRAIRLENKSTYTTNSIKFETFVKIKKQIINTAKNELHQVNGMTNQALWRTISREYYKI